MMIGWHTDQWTGFTGGILPSWEGVLRIYENTIKFHFGLLIWWRWWRNLVPLFERTKINLNITSFGLAEVGFLFCAPTHGYWIRSASLSCTLGHVGLNINRHCWTPLEAYKYKWLRSSFGHNNINHILLFYLIWFNILAKEKVIWRSEVSDPRLAQN